MKNKLQFDYAEPTGERKIYQAVPHALLSQPEWALQVTDVKTSQKIDLALTNICRIFDDRLQRFLCVTIYVMNEEGKFLLLLHRKFNKWLPPGGKVDGHETPDEAAVRECYEETGVRVELVGEKALVDGGLVTPLGVQLNAVDPGRRDHIDLIYAARPIELAVLQLSEREADGIGWYSYEEILEMETFPSVRQWCQQLCRR